MIDLLVPLVDLKTQYQTLKNEIDDAIRGVIEETAFIGGARVSQFESRFAELLGVERCIGCGNGTDSLYVIMKMLGIGPGDEVITVANSWISTSETISQTGASPVFVDVDPVYYTLAPNLIEEKLNEKTKAIIPVHIFGQPCDMTEIVKLCEKHKLYLIEDCAQAHLAEFEGKVVGKFGNAGSFSFYPGKNLGAYGDAGCIVTDDTELATQCQMYARHGALVKHDHRIEGINSRLDGLQAAILSAKLPHLVRWTNSRIQRASEYTELLKEVEEVRLPQTRPGCKHVFHLYVIQAEARDELAAFLKAQGIQTGIHYPTPLPFLPCYEHLNHSLNDFPVANMLKTKILSLPMFAELTSEQVRRVTDGIKQFYSQRRS